MASENSKEIIVPEPKIIEPAVSLYVDETASQLRHYTATPLQRLIQGFDSFYQTPLLAETMTKVKDRMIAEHGIPSWDFISSAYNDEFEKDVSAELLVAKMETKYAVVDRLGGSEAWLKEFKRFGDHPILFNLPPA